jgi:hypothetical protein
MCFSCVGAATNEGGGEGVFIGSPLKTSRCVYFVSFGTSG